MHVARLRLAAAQDGKELEVSGLPQPFQLTVPVSDGDELERSCVGQPDAASLLERMLGGEPPCRRAKRDQGWG